MNTTDLIESLEYILDKIEGYVDINVHGGPNDAMRAVEEVENVLAALRKLQQAA